ncbi:hypothetical protein [Methylocystis sp. ATCC 49242]|uniref:hypothetical protein n=1 Tax=Methylocystis sp. ATCC 49242 TaxID=622637 RepID=UPI001185C860|nr:hypothetical protein [Methylocystis sp. ATCC 49242]
MKDTPAQRRGRFHFRDRKTIHRRGGGFVSETVNIRATASDAFENPRFAAKTSSYLGRKGGMLETPRRPPKMHDRISNDDI